MDKKYRIVDVHREDAFFPDREALIGCVVDVSEAHRSIVDKGYVAGTLYFKKPVSIDGNLNGGLYFLAVKVEPLGAKR